MLVLIVILLTAFALLNTSWAQNAIVQKVTKELSETLETEVSVGKINYRLFNTFHLNNLYVQDLNKDTLAFVQKLEADFDFWQIFKGKLLFNTIEIDKFDANLTFDLKGVSNLDFIIEKFKKPKKRDTSKPIEFNIKDIKLKDSSFRLLFREDSLQKSKTQFNGRNMFFSAINAQIAVDYLKNDSMIVHLKSFSTKEQAGLDVRNIETEVRGFNTGFRMPYLNIKLPNSELIMDSVKMEYDSIQVVKDIFRAVRWKSKIRPSYIALDDISTFYSNFKGMTSPIQLQGNLDGTISSFRVKELELQYKKSFVLKANVDMNGIPNIDETFLYADIKDFSVNKYEAQDFVSNITKQPFVLPNQLSQLGTIKYKGNISGFFSNLVAYGTVSTDAGVLKTDILVRLENQFEDLYYSGSLQSGSFNLGKLVENNLLGRANFKITTNGSKLHNKNINGTVQGKIPEIYFNNYNYTNIEVNGDYDGTGFEGTASISDPNLEASFYGLADFSKKLPVFNFDLAVENTDLNALKITPMYENAHLSFTANTNVIGNSLDNLNGFCLLDNIRFENKDRVLKMNQFLFESLVEDNNSYFSITSDYVNGSVSGKFKYSVLPTIFSSIVEEYLPAFSNSKTQIKNVGISSSDNYIDVYLIVKNTKQITEILDLPFTLDGISSVNGLIDEKGKTLLANASIPSVSFSGRNLENLNLTLNNEEEQLNLLANGDFQLNNSPFNVKLKINGRDNLLHSQIDWLNQDSIKSEGEFQFDTHFINENSAIATIINIIPTQMVIRDSIWDIHTAQINFKTDSTIDIHNLKLQNKLQHITIDGVASKNENDLLFVQMNEIDLNFILEMLKFDAIKINGLTSGMVYLNGILKQPAFEANLQIKDAHLNNSLLGDAQIHSGWDNVNEELLISGTFTEKNKTVALANGFYSLKNDSIDFIFDANQLNLGFLEKYLSSIIQNLSGRGTGLVRMFGSTKNIGFEGNALVENARAKIDFLNTTYSFTDSVYLTRKSIALKKIKIYDEEKNQGVLNGLITHDGSFKNMEYDVKIDAKNVLALNTKSTDNDYFYGKAYATGNIHIHGNEDESNIDIVAQSQPNTKVFISTGGKLITNSNEFITFIKKDTTEIVTTSTNKKHTDLHLMLQLDVQPNAEVQFIINPESGDMISGSGSGNLRLEIEPHSDMKLYGNYTIEKGNYFFSLQNLLRKQFKIEQGSTINWSGNPLDAKLNIQANYSITASLYDLMSEDILASNDRTRTSIPVECILKITDDLMHPAIAFDINLPSSDETLKLQVKNLINTDEMMNRQMIYLLLFGKFYTPDYNRNTTNAMTQTNAGLSLITNTLSGQLNNWLSQISNNVSLGVNYRTAGYGSTVSQEYEGEIMYQPNNRLIINGNFGYRDDNFAKNKIIGDLDIEYILTENAKWRLKAYNHTVDRYSLRTSPFIRGVGIVYKESFNNWNDLWREYIKSFKKDINKTEENDEENKGN